MSVDPLCKCSTLCLFYVPIVIPCRFSLGRLAYEIGEWTSLALQVPIKSNIVVSGPVLLYIRRRCDRILIVV